MNPVPLASVSAGDAVAVSALAVAFVVLVGAALAISHNRAKPPSGDELGKRQYTRKQRRLAVIAGLAGATAFVLLFWRGPWWFDGLHIRKTQLDSADGVVITGFRTGLVALAAGLVAAVGLCYTREKHRLERDEFQHAQEQFRESQKQFETTLRETQERDERQAELTREGQVTGRYVEAIKLLGSDKLAERLGGIYALERIMGDSQKDYITVVRVLTAYLREPVDHPEEDVSGDRQAAFTVLVRRPEYTGNGFYELDFRGAHLRGVFGNGYFTGADFTKADLTNARLIDCSASRTNFTEAVLDGADLMNSAMEGADFSRASLNGTTNVLHHRDAQFRGTDLTNTGDSYEHGMIEDWCMDEDTKLPEA
ncbi:pentapeptide repeat-containing protein [Streptomyces sp. NPDC052114]|uniref:pentapeptide repeat-containing protein n=1 Tax=unclassified Streptomyces TaxID=2593676 RepID=UPI00343F4480